MELVLKIALAIAISLAIIFAAQLTILVIEDVNMDISKCIESGECPKAKITKIVSGDTIDLSNGERIRLSMVNAPDRDEAGYYESLGFWDDKCPVRSKVIVDYDDLQDGDHIFGAIHCDKGQRAKFLITMNERLVESGYAEILEKHCTLSKFGETDWAKGIGC